MRINVVFPAPFSPTSAWTVPRPTVNDTASSATELPNRLLIPVSASTVSASEMIARGDVTVP
jgi:hypothetical protein